MFSAPMARHWNTYRGSRGSVVLGTNLPAHWPQPGDLLHHVLLPVMTVHHGVELEEDAIGVTPLPDPVQAGQVLLPAPRSVPTNLVVDLTEKVLTERQLEFHLAMEGVTGDGEDVKVVTKLSHPGFGHLCEIFGL